MLYRFYTCDVFTETRFGGNPLAVLPEAEGLSDRQMQDIAREFNFSETTFVFPPEAGQTRKVRIFTPGIEVPFAGHPNVGTAFVLAAAGELGEIEDACSVTFEEKAGIVPISIRKGDAPGARITCELRAPEELSLGRTIPAPLLAGAISLDASDVVTTTHPPRVGSVGLPFVIAELADRDALERIRVDVGGIERLAAETGVTPDIHVYTHSSDEFDLRARMFAPLDGVPEDPATGSACCALAGLLAERDERTEGSFSWRITQGVEMGRPSVMDARAEKRSGKVLATWVGGNCVLVSEGVIEVD